MITCKAATRLMSEAQDRPLAWHERAHLRFHLLFCKGCRNFQQQLDVIRTACRNIFRS